MYDVFFIDDESDIRLAIEQSFELEEISAQFFSSAEDALLAIKQDGLPKVVISDICLPGLSGENLLSTVLHQDKDVPVILITGHGDISMAVNALRNGAYDLSRNLSPSTGSSIPHDADWKSVTSLSRIRNSSAVSKRARPSALGS